MKLRRGRFHDGAEDGFEPLVPLDVTSTTTFREMLEQMSRTAFGARRLGEAYEVLCAMVDDPDCQIIVTLSGAMTVAKMGLVLVEMIQRGMAHFIVSTGALMAHGLAESVGGTHYKYRGEMDDETLYRLGYDRVYDTLELEKNLYDSAEIIREAYRSLDPTRPFASFELHREIGRILVEKGLVPSILGAAYQKGVPVYVPAFTDSELGLEVAVAAIQSEYRPGKEADLDALFAPVPNFNPFLDLYDFAKRLVRAKRIGIFTIGGGVPRNWGQEMGPFVEILNDMLGADLPVPRIHYGVRICPEPVHWGGLSGCTYSEGVSWGKFVPPSEGGRFAEVYSDATIAWPLLIRAVIERQEAS